MADRQRSLHKRNSNNGKKKGSKKEGEKMKLVYLLRFKTSDQGTEGMLITLDGFTCKTLELPWRDNQRSISCIPPGEYHCKIRHSNKFGKTYWVTEVPSRSYILIHSGNFAGDKAKGFKTHVEGCILLGKKHGYLSNQRAILNSRITVRAFMNSLRDQDFTLTVVGGPS
jgi:hypothetical protein